MAFGIRESCRVFSARCGYREWEGGKGVGGFEGEFRKSAGSNRVVIMRRGFFLSFLSGRKRGKEVGVCLDGWIGSTTSGEEDMALASGNCPFFGLTSRSPTLPVWQGNAKGATGIRAKGDGFAMTGCRCSFSLCALR